MTTFTSFLKEESETLHPFGSDKHAMALKKKFPDVFESWTIKEDVLDKKHGTYVVKYYDKKELVRLIAEDVGSNDSVKIYCEFSIPFTDTVHVYDPDVYKTKVIESLIEDKQKLNDILSKFDTDIKPFEGDKW